jgi:hypothetical protein
LATSDGAVTAQTTAARALLSAEAVRQRCQRMLVLGLEGKLPHFRVELDRLERAAELVIDSTQHRYPGLEVPWHSRWRHFTLEGEDRWARLERTTAWPDAAERARAAFDLAIVSVLLDAGAHPHWRYHDPVTGKRLGRSEGLALASLAMFADGAFSEDRRRPLSVDAGALRGMRRESLCRHFQVGEGNPLPGIDGRLALLRRLGEVVAGNPRVFASADRPRPGGLFDHLIGLAQRNRIAAPRILAEILHHLGPIWPSRLQLGGVPLGDCWRHPGIATNDATSGLVPLHKLSQWLTYSLLEPLTAAGFEVVDVDGLTGLAEYRNGGLMIDTGVLALRDPAATTTTHDVGSALIVEWRALTVALLDRLAETVRRRLNVDALRLPLGKILQGGSWAAGRQLAATLRADGAPPLKIHSDGTVF